MRYSYLSFQIYLIYRLLTYLEVITNMYKRFAVWSIMLIIVLVFIPILQQQSKVSEIALSITDNYLPLEYLQCYHLSLSKPCPLALLIY